MAPARGRSSSLGFGAQVIAPEDRGTGEIFREVAPEDLLKYGLILEFPNVCVAICIDVSALTVFVAVLESPDVFGTTSETG
jgi:ATP-dependent protease Clp ATPase subunit